MVIRNDASHFSFVVLPRTCRGALRAVLGECDDGFPSRGYLGWAVLGD